MDQQNLNGATTPSSTQEEPATSASASSQKQKPKKILPTHRISFPKQIDLLRAFAIASGPTGKPVSAADVSEIVKMHPNTISFSNAFFVDAGFLQKSGSGFMPSQEVVNFNLAYQWNPEIAAQKLAPLLQETWFGQLLIPRLGFRRMTENEAIGALAEAASADPEYRGQLKMLLAYLEKAGLIAQEGDMIKEGTAIAASQTERSPSSSAITERDPAPKTTSISTTFSQPTEGVIQFHVSVKVNMNEFSGWAPDRITAFFGGIAQVLSAKGAMEKNVAET
jgi:hypothetical protein